MKAQHVAEALDRRYGQKPGNQRGEQWVTIREARAGASFDGNRGQCDYLAINTWKGQGLQLIGHEIKVSAADWKRELATQGKAELFARFCRRWWVVMPSKLAKECKPEIPPTWGLLSVSDKGNATEIVKAPARDPQAVPEWWWIGWLAQIDRQEKRASARELDAVVAEKLAEQRDQLEKQINRQSRYSKQSHDRLSEKVQEFRKATGIDLMHSWPDEWRRFAELWQLSRSGRPIDVLAKQLRETAEMLDELAIPDTQEDRG